MDDGDHLTFVTACSAPAPAAFRRLPIAVMANWAMREATIVGLDHTSYYCRVNNSGDPSRERPQLRRKAARDRRLRAAAEQPIGPAALSTLRKTKWSRLLVWARARAAGGLGPVGVTRTAAVWDGTV
jgi:hypothetical protein